jgi:hypothetical protein
MNPDGLWRRIGELLDRFTPDECANYLITTWVAAGTDIRPPFRKCHIVANERSSCSGSYHSTQWNAGEIYIYDASRDRQWQRKVPGGRWCW